MGSFCSYLCKCLFNNESNKKLKKSKESPKREITVSLGSVTTVSTMSDIIQEYKVPSNEYKTIEEVLKFKGYDPEQRVHLDAGGFAAVYKITRIADKKVVAVKEMPIKAIDNVRDTKKYENFKNEIFVISKIKHKNVVSLVDHFIINEMCYLFMEFANGGNVHQEVERVGPKGELQAKQYFKQMCRGVEHLHLAKYEIAHRDVKLHNFLIHQENKEKIIKITDFGFSKALATRHTKQFRVRKAEGTMGYMSPQLIQLILYDRYTREERKKLGKVKTVNAIKADIWALGICLYYMINACLPFDFPEDDKDLVIVLEKQMTKTFKPNKQNISSALNDLIHQMLEPNTAERITILDILDHQCLKSVTEEIYE